MLSAIRRTWPFDSSCSRTRVMSLEVSPLFYLSPLRPRITAKILAYLSTWVRIMKPRVRIVVVVVEVIILRNQH